MPSSCWSARSPPDAGRAGRGQGRIKSEQTLLTRQQIEDPRFSTAYDAVRALRSNWLHARGNASFRFKIEVQVYLDGTHLGGVQALQGISTPAIQYIRYSNGTDATTRWGIGHGRGVIFIGTGPLPEPGAPPHRDAARGAPRAPSARARAPGPSRH